MTADSDREAFRLALPDVLKRMAAAEGEDAVDKLVYDVLSRHAIADPRVAAAVLQIEEIAPGVGLLETMKLLAEIGRLPGWE